MAKSTLGFSFMKRTVNENYAQAFVEPLRACPLHNNSGNYPGVKIATQPKYITTLRRDFFDTETGEIGSEEYLTDCFKSYRGRLYKRMYGFAERWQPEYSKRRVSMFMITFTRVTESKTKWSRMIDIVKYRAKSLGYELLDYFWVSEVSDNNHWHYHLVTVTKRMNLRGKTIPDVLKFDDIWGCRTQVAFVEKSIKSYLCYYLNKSQAKVIGLRGCGSSRLQKKETIKTEDNAITQKKAGTEKAVRELLHPVYA